MGASVIVFFVGIPLLTALGIDSQPWLDTFVSAIGAAVLIVDYRLRRRDQPTSPMWRLLDPRAGGHILIVPCWLIGASLLLFGFGGFSDCLQGWYPVLPRGIRYLGFIGFFVPAAGDYLYPNGTGAHRHTNPEQSTPIAPS